jgi:micrococcal nuclease
MRVRITEVVDGDTLHVVTGAGQRERVRLIGIDAPERSTTRTGYPECGGQAATELLESLAMANPSVRLVADPGQDVRDRFGRLLAYVEPNSGAHETFQLTLLRAGLARVYVYARDPFGRVAEFRAAAQEARDARRGVWRDCGGDFRRAAR